MVDVEWVSSLFKIAMNEIPASHKDIGKTNAEVNKMINDGVIEIQKKLIAYESLASSVRMEKSKKVRDRIMNNAQHMIDKEIVEIIKG